MKTTADLVIYLWPVLTICFGLFCYILYYIRMSNRECYDCGAPAVEDEKHCAKCRQLLDGSDIHD